MRRLLLLVAFLAVGCGGSTQQAAPPAPTPRPTSVDPFAAFRSANATITAPTTQAQATAQAQPRPPIGFEVVFDPGFTLQVGQKFTITLRVTNKGQQELRGIRVFATGLAKLAVASVLPSGTASTTEIRSDLVFPPSETRSLIVTASPREAGRYRISFTPMAVEGTSVGLADETGTTPTINADLVVSG